MLIHAENKKEKRVISCHIVTGQICKNCLNFIKIRRNKIWKITQLILKKI